MCLHVHDTCLQKFELHPLFKTTKGEGGGLNLETIELAPSTVMGGLANGMEQMSLLTCSICVQYSSNSNSPPIAMF